MPQRVMLEVLVAEESDVLDDDGVNRRSSSASGCDCSVGFHMKYDDPGRRVASVS